MHVTVLQFDTHPVLLLGLVHPYAADFLKYVHPIYKTRFGLSRSNLELFSQNGLLAVSVQLYTDLLTNYFFGVALEPIHTFPWFAVCAKLC